MSAYDPIPDAIRFLAHKAPTERQAIARLLYTDGKSPPVLQWIVEQPDCDHATAAMTFWRPWGLPVRSHHARQADASARTAILESIAANLSAGRYAAAKIAWERPAPDPGMVDRSVPDQPGPRVPVPLDRQGRRDLRRPRGKFCTAC